MSKVDKDRLREAADTLRRYKAGKAHMEKRIVDSEQYWKLQHWSEYAAGNPGDPKPVSGWLVSVVLNRHADAMDAYPEPNCLPRAADDEQEAKTLSKVLPVVLKQVRFRKTYSRVMYDKIKYGAGIYGVFWNSRALHGLGNIAIRRINPLNLFWEPGIEDIQESRELFCVEEMDKDAFDELYPKLKDKVKANTGESVTKFRTEDSDGQADTVLVVDWYYHKDGVLHYCKFCGDEVLFATENEEGYRDRGWYDHGKYPFVVDVLFPEEGTPCGFGFVDICKDPQKYADVLNQAILKNTVAAATPRFFIKDDGAVNEAEYADFTKPFVHTDGGLGQDSIMPVQSTPLPSSALSVLQYKINEMRETSGNTESATGVASSSVTAASAIAALQEASGKLSRDMNGTTYDAYEQVVLLCIELIRQFYDLPRTYRITGDMGALEYTEYSNAGIVPQPITGAAGAEIGYRTPEFDIEVSPQSESRYTKAEYNELAMSLYGAGFFNPQMADQALVALGMMDFKGKDKTMQTIRDNGTMWQQLQALQAQVGQMATIIDAQNGTNISAELGVGMAQPAAPAPAPGMAQMPRSTGGESTVTAKARAQSQQATQPR